MSPSLEKQKLLLEYLISSPDVYSVCSPIIKPEYFDVELRKTAGFITDYYKDYSSTPDPTQIRAETGVELGVSEVTADKFDYCTHEVEAFCKDEAFKKALLEGPKLMKEGRKEEMELMIKEALLISLHRNLGTSYFDNPLERLQRLASSKRTLSTGWKDVDAKLNGGISRKEMVLFSANSGGGKSIAMANLALNLVQQGQNVLVISLELDEDLISKRFDGMVTGIHQAEIIPRMKEVATKVEQAKEGNGELDIIQMSAGTRALDIEGFLKEYTLIKGFKPDALVIDYLDLMAPNEKVSADNVFQKDKMISEQIRDLGVVHDMFIITASQQNRGAIDADELHQGHIAGGISKVNTTDVYISIIMTEAMRAKGEMAFQFLKTRNSDGVGKIVYLTWNNITLRITDGEGRKDDMGETQESKPHNPSFKELSKPVSSGNDILDLLNV